MSHNSASVALDSASSSSGSRVTSSRIGSTFVLGCHTFPTYTRTETESEGKMPLFLLKLWLSYCTCVIISMIFESWFCPKKNKFQNVSILLNKGDNTLSEKQVWCINETETWKTFKRDWYCRKWRQLKGTCEQYYCASFQAVISSCYAKQVKYNL